MIQEIEVFKHRKHQTYHKKNPSLATKLGFPPVQSEKNQCSNIYVLLMSQIKITAASLEFFLSIRVSEGRRKRRLKWEGSLRQTEYLSLEQVIRIN